MFQLKHHTTYNLNLMTKKLKHTTNYLENGRGSALVTQICSKLPGFVANRLDLLPFVAVIYPNWLEAPNMHGSVL